jgi:hypothetical protein
MADVCGKLETFVKHNPERLIPRGENVGGKVSGEEDKNLDR